MEIDYQLHVIKAMAEKIERLESELRKSRDYTDILTKELERLRNERSNASNPDVDNRNRISDVIRLTEKAQLKEEKIIEYD